MNTKASHFLKLTFVICGLITIPMPSEAAEAPTPSREVQTIEVSDVDQFWKAVGSNRTIRLRQGTYDFTADDRSGKHYRSREVHDGFERVIHGVTGLNIVGAAGVKLHVSPRYAHVFCFEECRQVTLENVLLVHSPDLGYCQGGVLHFAQCEEITIRGCILDGSGIEGLTLTGVKRLSFLNSTIRNCTYGIMTLEDCVEIRFSKGSFTRNSEFDLVNIKGCESIEFDNCRFTGNRSNTENDFDDYCLFAITGSKGVVVRDSKFRNNQAPFFAKTRGSIEVVNCLRSRNRFTKGEYRSENQ